MSSYHPRPALPKRGYSVYVKTPPRGSLLHARAVPVRGGGLTSSNYQYLAYERLPEPLKKRIEGLHICHDNTRNTAGRLRPTVELPSTRADITGPLHPIVRIHPLTRRRALIKGEPVISPWASDTQASA